MKCTCIGIENVDYDKKDGSHVVGIKLHIYKSPSTSAMSRVRGAMVDTIWVSGASRFLDLYDRCRNFPVPCDINVEYELDGRFQNLVDIQLIDSPVK